MKYAILLCIFTAMGCAAPSYVKGYSGKLEIGRSENCGFFAGRGGVLMKCEFRD